jgi:transposase
MIEKEESMDKFYEWLGEKKTKCIRLAVMDMWRPFRNSLIKNAPDAKIIYDKFHIMKHLGEAMDKVRKSEQLRMADKDKKFIKGQKYTLLCNEENLSKEGRKNLKLLLAANKRINTAYILKESFEQLWSYKTEGWARRFFENWRESLKWQRIEPYEKFAAMIDRHWDGIASYCDAENKVPLGYVERLNNKIRVLQRRAYGLNDEEYFRLKILTCSLPEF